MAEPFSQETQDLLDAADRAIAHSGEIVAQRRKMMADARRTGARRPSSARVVRLTRFRGY
jgi:hypothetical protein